MNMTQRTVRIFISSTFRDFDDERRLMVQEVFPALRQRLRDRFVELVDVDLRWGVSAEQAAQGRVLSICLDEIDQCRPYFIGLLGERYGWTPKPPEFPEPLLDEHPWLEGHRGQASVTELEIRYGVLDNPAMRGRALFFFRDPAYALQRDASFRSASSQDTERQRALKLRIENSGFPTQHYTTPEQMAELLAAQLWDRLDAEFPARDVPDALTRETLQHQSFAVSKVGPRYLADSQANQGLRDALALGHQRVLVSGAAGFGKSTLIAEWVQNSAEQNSASQGQAIVLSHFLEAGDESASVTDLVRRLIELIRSRTGSVEHTPEDRKGLLASLPVWLAVADAYANRINVRWVIVLDGLDRLRDGRNLLWLPIFIPKRIQFIVSSRPGPIQRALKRRGNWHSIELQTLGSERVQTLLERQLTLFKKTLEPQQTVAIVSDPRAGNPLFLCSLIEELRVFGSFERVNEHLNELLSSTEVDDLFQRVLHRLENNHGREAVESVLSVLCLSRSGLTEEEVLGISGLNYQARWAPIRLALGESLTNSVGRVRYANGYLSKAVRERYFASTAAERALRLRLAHWFGARPLDRRRAWEQPYQLWKAEAYTELLKLLGDPAMFALIDRPSGSQGLHRFWVDIEASTGVSAYEHYRQCWSEWRSELALEFRIDLASRLQRLLHFSGVGGVFLVELVEDQLRACELAFGVSDLRYLKQLGLCASTLSRQKNQLELARQLADDSCKGIERTVGPEAPDLASALLILARIHLIRGDVKQGLEAARRGLSLQEASVGPQDASLVPYLNCLTDLLLKKGGRVRRESDGRRLGRESLYEGIELQTRCLRILRSTFGLEHLDAIASIVRTGRVFERCDERVNAARAYKKALDFRTRLLGNEHALTKSARKLLEGVS